MNRIIPALLIFSLFLICFTACEQQETTVTPTDSVVKVEQQAVQSSSQPNTTDQPQEQTQSKAEITTVTETASDQEIIQPAEKNTVTVKPASKAESGETEDNPKIDIPEETACWSPMYPRFFTEEDYANWLRNGTGGYETDRTAVLQMESSNQTITYFSPSEALLEFVTLESIETYTPSASISYRYTFENDQKINISPSTDAGYLTTYQNSYLQGKGNYYCYHDNESGIDYYYHCFSDLYSERTYVSWMQFGEEQFASIEGHRDQIDTLIPLLKLEQVTVKLNNDHVTQ